MTDSRKGAEDAKETRRKKTWPWGKKDPTPKSPSLPLCKGGWEEPPFNKGGRGGFVFRLSLRSLRLCGERVLKWFRSRLEIRPVTRLELIRELADREPWTQNEALIAVDMIARRGALFVMASPMLPPDKLIAGVRAQAYGNLEAHRSN